MSTFDEDVVFLAKQEFGKFAGVGNRWSVSKFMSMLIRSKKSDNPTRLEALQAIKDTAIKQGNKHLWDESVSRFK